VLRVAVDGLVLAEHAVEDAGGLLVVDFSLFAEVDAADPLVLDLLEGRLHLHQHCQLVEQVPQRLELAVDVRVLRGLADVGQTLDFSVGLLQLLPFFAFAVNFPLLLGCLGVGFFRRHSITPNYMRHSLLKLQKEDDRIFMMGVRVKENK